ncbi:MAG: autotransporter domain-containing protein [Sphingomonas sp.]
MTMTTRALSLRNRNWLLASAATLSLVIGGAAHAQSSAPVGSILSPQGSNPDPNVVISLPGTSTSDIDTTNITGVGQLVTDEKNGFIGLCTGTLINPRTVIFAAHCVNENPAGNGFQDPWNYGTGTGQLPIGIFFNANNNAAGNSALGHWLNGVAGGPADLTRINEYAYNINQILYNSQSTALGLGNNFLQADVALGVLDTPAANVPTWALLFSALPAPTSTNPVTGTGYHVEITGYGNNGTGNTGSGSIDFRRRVAENYIGLLGSLDDQDSFLFGAPDGLPQNLYMMDFDDPTRANPYDFNIFPDDATKHEGITAPGDSGGPLILDRTYAKKLVIAVLSGGDRFYGAQPSSSYGTTSFYQPLYMFWDYIAANNPYRYVSALAGDGNWTDPTHWTTNVDPAYNILVNGQLMTGVPTTPGTGIADTSPGFGSVCYFDVCENIVTGEVTVNGVPVNASEPAATGSTGGVATGLSSNLQAQNGSAQVAAAALPAPTLANGLPGATNFVPNNISPNAATHTNARYFDVTLSAAGTTTLDSSATVDRFTISGASSKLSVTSAGSLTSLINMNQYDGVVVNNGVMTSVGDYLLLSGAVQGSGRFNAPYFTNVTGVIAPGTIGGTGTLTFAGNLILSSGSGLMLDLGANGVSDKVSVVTTVFGANQVPVNGIASLGGTVMFSAATGYMIRAGDTYTIVTAQGGFAKDGAGNIIKFNNVVPISAILTPHLTYGTNAVTVSIDAGLYKDVVANTPVQNAFAALLDGDRANDYNALSGLYGPLDLQSAATIRGTLEGWAPRTETNRDALGTVAIDNMSRFYRDHVESIEVGNLGGSIAMIGHPFEMAANRTMNMPDTPEVRSDAGQTVMEARLPETMSAFVAGGYLNGTSATMPTALPVTGRDKFDGYFIAAGVEKEAGSHGVVGISFSYSDIGATPAYVSHAAKSQLYEGTLYGKIQTDGGFVANAMLSAGSFNSQTVRNVSLVGTNYRLTSNDRSLIVVGEVTFGQDFNLGALKFGPRVGVRATSIMFDDINEQGGPPALTYYRDSYDSLQARAGFHLSGGKVIKPYLSAYEVHELGDEPGLIAANFTGAVGPTALFAVAGQDKDWAEISGGLSYSTGKVELSIGADSTIWRTDVANQSYHGTVKFNF